MNSPGRAGAAEEGKQLLFVCFSGSQEQEAIKS